MNEVGPTGCCVGLDWKVGPTDDCVGLDWKEGPTDDCVVLDWKETGWMRKGLDLGDLMKL